MNDTRRLLVKTNFGLTLDMGPVPTPQHPLDMTRQGQILSLLFGSHMWFLVLQVYDHDFETEQDRADAHEALECMWGQVMLVPTDTAITYQLSA